MAGGPRDRGLQVWVVFLGGWHGLSFNIFRTNSISICACRFLCASRQWGGASTDSRHWSQRRTTLGLSKGELVPNGESDQQAASRLPPSQCRQILHTIPDETHRYVESRRQARPAPARVLPHRVWRPGCSGATRQVKTLLILERKDGLPNSTLSCRLGL